MPFALVPSLFPEGAVRNGTGRYEMGRRLGTEHCSSIGKAEGAGLDGTGRYRAEYQSAWFESRQGHRKLSEMKEGVRSDPNPFLVPSLCRAGAPKPRHERSLRRAPKSIDGSRFSIFTGFPRSILSIEEPSMRGRTAWTLSKPRQAEVIHDSPRRSGGRYATTPRSGECQDRCRMYVIKPRAESPSLAG